MLRDKPRNRWQRVLKHLLNAELKTIRQQFANYPYPDLFVALHVSVETQPALIQRLYLDLAIFPEDKPIPEAVLEIYWSKEDLQHYEVLDIVDELLDASLIFRYDDQSIFLHDLQRDYIRSQCPDIQLRHSKLVKAYETSYPNGWHTIPHAKPRYFHDNFLYHSEQSLDSDKSKSIAAELLTKDQYLLWSQVLACTKITGISLDQIAPQLIKNSKEPETLVNCIKIVKYAAKEDAQRLLKQENQNSDVLTVCLSFLGVEAKDEARRLLKQKNQNSAVLIACLNLLGTEVKDEARRLLKQENQNSAVLIACLNLLGAKAKDDAWCLLKQENQNSDVVAVCLRLLGAEAKEDARRLLKQENQPKEVVNVCLNILGAEAKDEARRLLKQESQHCHVIGVCLNLLGAEAKDEAWRLLKQENQPKEVINVCLNILGAEAKDEAWRLLKQENQHYHVVGVCLNLLGADAKDEARRLLKQESQHYHVVGVCLNLLGAEAKDEARRLLKQDNQISDVIGACLDVLGGEAAEFAIEMMKSDEWVQLNSRLQTKILTVPIKGAIRERRALEVLSKWRLHYRPLVKVALDVFDEDYHKVTQTCSEILKRWRADYNYAAKKGFTKYYGYIIKSMRHPELKTMSKLVALEMVEIEKETPGFLGEELSEFAQYVVDGVKFDWNDEM